MQSPQLEFLHNVPDMSVDQIREVLEVNPEWMHPGETLFGMTDSVDYVAAFWRDERPEMLKMFFELGFVLFDGSEFSLGEYIADYFREDYPSDEFDWFLEFYTREMLEHGWMHAMYEVVDKINHSAAILFHKGGIGVDMVEYPCLLHSAAIDNRDSICFEMVRDGLSPFCPPNCPRACWFENLYLFDDDDYDVIPQLEELGIVHPRAAELIAERDAARVQYQTAEDEEETVIAFSDEEVDPDEEFVWYE